MIVKMAAYNNLTHLHRDRGYRFHDRDPILEELCGLITASGLSIHTITQRIVKISGGGAAVAPPTIYRWLDGTVKRPQNFTIDWVARALGYERRFTRID